MKDIICFEVNDWEAYPKFFEEWFDFSNGDKHPGRKWFPDLDAYAKENKLCIVVSAIDMAISLTITAPKDWVTVNIPEFKKKAWRDVCVYNYPHPYNNASTVWRPSGIKAVRNKKYSDYRKGLLEQMHKEYTDEQLANLMPHDLTGCPSGIKFLDYEEKNFGAINVDTDYDGNFTIIWRVVNGEVIEEDLVDSK